MRPETAAVLAAPVPQHGGEPELVVDLDHIVRGGQP